LVVDGNVVQNVKEEGDGWFGVSQRKLEFNPELHLHRTIHRIGKFSFCRKTAGFKSLQKTT
jgi:hypothetical protein